MKENEIIQDVGKETTTYSVGTIGITNDPNRRKNEHGDPKYWNHWRADTVAIARNVEKYFLEKGMKGAIGDCEHLNFVYIFLLYRKYMFLPFC